MQAKTINVEGRDAVAIELDVPLTGLKPGSYLCQLNVIDDAGGQLRISALCGAGAPAGSCAGATPPHQPPQPRHRHDNVRTGSR